MMHNHLAHQEKASTFFSTNYFKCSQKIYKIKMGRCEKECLIFLFQYQNCPDTFPSLNSIIDGTEASKKTVIKALSNLEENLKFIKIKRISGISNSYEILFDNIEDAYQAILVNEKRSRIRLVEPVAKKPLVSKKTVVQPVANLPLPPVAKKHLVPGANMPPVPVANLHPDNNDLKITIYNNDDDKAQRAEISTSSSQKNTVQQPAAEQPVSKKKFLTNGELFDKLKTIIFDGEKPAQWISFDLFSMLQLTGEECVQIVKFAQANGKQIQKFNLVSPEDVSNAVLDMQDRMNRKPEKEYNPTQVTQDELEANLLKRGYKIDYN